VLGDIEKSLAIPDKDLPMMLRKQAGSEGILGDAKPKSRARDWQDVPLAGRKDGMAERFFDEHGN
jgi:hypothetical protein